MFQTARLCHERLSCPAIVAMTRMAFATEKPEGSDLSWALADDFQHPRVRRDEPVRRSARCRFGRRRPPEGVKHSSVFHCCGSLEENVGLSAEHLPFIRIRIALLSKKSLEVVVLVEKGPAKLFCEDASNC